MKRFVSFPGGLSIAVRKEYAATALRMAAEAPILGKGAGNYALHTARLKPERGEETRFAHDDYLEILAEQGTPPPSGRRRRRYRDEDTEDDVLSRVLRRT